MVEITREQAIGKMIATEESALIRNRNEIAQLELILDDKTKASSERGEAERIIKQLRTKIGYGEGELRSLRASLVSGVSPSEASRRAGQVSVQIKRSIAREETRREKQKIAREEKALALEQQTRISRKIGETKEQFKERKSIEERVKEEPLGKITEVKEDKPKIKTFFKRLSDVFTGLTFGFLTPFATTSTLETSKTPSETKAELQKIPKRAFKESTIIGLTLPFGKKVGLKGSGEFGVGTSFIEGLQKEQIKSAFKIRAEGEKTIAHQQAQVQAINKVTKRIEKEQSKLSDTTKFQKDVTQFQKDTAKFEEDLRTTKAISNIGSFPEKISRLETRRQSLETRRKSLLQTEQKLLKEQKGFEDVTVKELKGLRKIGVETKFTSTGDIQFTSKQLEKKVAPVGIKLQKSFLKDGKLSSKNILLGTTAITREVGIAYGVGLATGGVGAIARISSKVAQLPKVARVGVKLGAVGLAGTGIGLSTYKGYKVGQIEGIGKLGAVIRGLTATGQIAGFGAGAFKGTKIHFTRIEKQIISGRTTKTFDVKTGIKAGKGGLAKQLSQLETKITGTKLKITSFAEVKTKFLSKIGKSDVQIVSKLSGKVPTGLPKKIISKGQTMETKDLIKLRLFTEVKGIKGLQKQDILISKKVLDVKGVSVAGKPFYKPFTKLERVKLISGIKTIGKPIKVKVIPAQIFTSGERYLFRATQRVAGYGEFAEAKTDSFFTSKQFILSTKAIKIGDIKVSRFATLGKSRGASVDVLKESIKGKLLILDLKTKHITALPLDKRGQVALFSPPKIKLPKLDFKTPKISTQFKTSIDTKHLLKIQLKSIVPKIIVKESALVSTAIVPTTAGLVGLKELLKIRVEQKSLMSMKSLTSLKLDMGLKVAQITQMKIAQTPKLKIAQILKTSIITAPITQPVVTTTPPIVALPTIPPLPKIDIKKITGTKKKRKRKRVAEILTYSEGFTAKQLGLSPRVLSPINVQKLLKQKLTGLGIRRGIIVK